MRAKPYDKEMAKLAVSEYDGLAFGFFRRLCVSTKLPMRLGEAPDCHIIEFAASELPTALRMGLLTDTPYNDAMREALVFGSVYVLSQQAYDDIKELTEGMPHEPAPH